MRNHPGSNQTHQYTIGFKGFKAEFQVKIAVNKSVFLFFNIAQCIAIKEIILEFEPVITFRQFTDLRSCIVSNKCLAIVQKICPTSRFIRYTSRTFIPYISIILYICQSVKDCSLFYKTFIQKITVCAFILTEYIFTHLF